MTAHEHHAVSSGAAGDATPATPATRIIDARRLGLIGYDEGIHLQKSLVEGRRAGTIRDTLLLLEHPAVITLGAKNRGMRTHVVASDDELAREGIAVHDTGRGGDVTYHGPGQLVGYPIFDLRPDRCDIHRYIRDLEQAIIFTLERFGVQGGRLEGLSGVWVGHGGRQEKIAAIGVRVSRWITSHGFALNVATNLDHFRLIVPCGIADHGVTSLERVSGRAIPMAEVQEAVVDGFERVFGS